MISSLQNELQIFLSDKFGISISSFEFSRIGGGSINQTYQVLINKKEKLFCKINSASRFTQMFEREKSGLELLGSQKIIRVPNVIGTLKIDDYQILLLEWIEQGNKSAHFWKIFGEQLAALHLIPQTYSGLKENNFMGALAQSNTPNSNWVDFFIYERLQPQIKLATDKKLLTRQYQKHFDNLYKALPDIFPSQSLSLLHGDLWSGNFLCDHSGMPVLIDPAVYNGHQSMDLGMTTLFGGFDPLFYECYNYQFPFPRNHQHQWEICNLYPLLIHLNLFGKGYLQAIISTIQYY